MLPPSLPFFLVSGVAIKNACQQVLPLLQMGYPSIGHTRNAKNNMIKLP